MPPSSRSSPMSSRSTAEHPAVSVHPTPVHFGDPFLPPPSQRTNELPAGARHVHSMCSHLALLNPTTCFTTSLPSEQPTWAPALLSVQMPAPVPRYSSLDDDAPVVMTRCPPLLSPPLSLPPAAPPSTPVGPPPAAAEQTTFEVPPKPRLCKLMNG
ncbi:hypothetical protein BC826DRAFT_1102876 [Russula brevipes]|nr:hypothetical protein BC826DRAFT_1102876 [Russula brevipes]